MNDQALGLLHLNILYFTIFFVLWIFTFSFSSLLFREANAQGSLSGTLSDILENETAVNNTASDIQRISNSITESIVSNIANILGLENTTAVIITEAQSLSPPNEIGIDRENKVTQIDGKEVVLKGDIILKIDNFKMNQINQTKDIIAVLEKKKPGDMINLTLLKNGHVEDRTLMIVGRHFPNFIERLAGKYINPEAGLHIDLPHGWNGLRSRGMIDFGIIGPNTMNLIDIDKQNVVMKVLVEDLPFIQKVTSQLNDLLSVPSHADIEKNGEKCKMLSNSYGTSNKTLLLDIVDECGTSVNYTKSRYVMMATPQKLITITFKANSNELYEANLPNFNNSLATLQVGNLVDVQQVLTDLSKISQPTIHNGPAVNDSSKLMAPNINASASAVRDYYSYQLIEDH